MKTYRLETMFISLAMELTEYLKLNNIRYCVAGVPGPMYIFKIQTDPAGAAQINAFIKNVTIPGVHEC